jgi:hypothetical protein
MAAELGWSQDRTDLELAGYREAVAAQLAGEAAADDAAAYEALSRIPDEAAFYGQAGPPLVR